MGLEQRVERIEQALGPDTADCAACSGPPRFMVSTDVGPLAPHVTACETCGRPARVVPFTLDLAHPGDDWRPLDER
jgi:hypothetical protein